MSKNVSRIPTSLPKVPALGKQIRYTEWLANVFLDKQNRKALPNLYKSVADREYERLLRERAATQNVREYLDQKSIAAWEMQQSHFSLRKDDVTTESALANTTNLKIPRVGKHHKSDGKKGGTSDVWRLQTYKDFATKLEKDNPTGKLTKQLADDAFRAALHRMPTLKTGGGINERAEKAIARCLGKESDEYWESRTAS